MIINHAPQHEAIISNVSEVGEFRIRNSAKAFSILSSGLYANKVRAIIRELSCNAVDSHVAAGKTDTPFDVHLPNQLESWFSIRDYGTGLNHDQVTNIYTTYFESSKTDSNAYIGALGLGSKSPFSYTENFTVTAVQNGKKGIYSAFINEQGVPSIAKMMEEETTDPNGVEIRFAVADRHDFDKFRQEAAYVYKYFKNRPVVSGYAEFQFSDPVYKDKDIIPGVHVTTDNRSRSVAVMGNIAYPIDIPSSDKTISDPFKQMLNCGLVIEFDIGELDFQASREGLSYIPQTIESINRKLSQLNDQLAIHIAIEANKIDNLWDRAIYLNKQKENYLWTSAVNKYVVDVKFPLLNATNNTWNSLHVFSLPVQDLVNKYNIVIRGFSKSRGSATSTNLKTNTTHKSVGSSNGTSQPVFVSEWKIPVSNDVYFVFNDTKVGALARAKHHWKNIKIDSYSSTVYVIEAADKTKMIQKVAFLAELMMPPAGKMLKASDLLEKDRSSSMGKNVTIMRLEEGTRRGYRDRAPMVWRDAGKADSFDSKDTYYYLPLSGFKCLGMISDIKSLEYNLRSSETYTGNIYGVRKADLEFIQTQKNWINLDTMVTDALAKLGQSDVMGLVKQSIDWKSLYQYNAIKHIKNAQSPYMVLYNTFKDVKESDTSLRQSLEWLCRQYKVETLNKIDPTALIDKYKQDVEAIKKRYPLIRAVSRHSVDSKDFAEYINLVDENKGI